MTEVAIVTGGGRGIGAAIAEALAREGARVVIAGNMPDVQEQKVLELSRFGYAAMACVLDITRFDSVSAMVNATVSRFGTPSILINNAGADTIKPFMDTHEAEWLEALDVNLVGAMRCTHQVIPLMQAAGYGRIVNISSDAGRVGASGQVAYSAAKAGLIGFMKALAREVVSDGITINAVCPGPTNTPLVEEILQRPHPQLYQALTRAIPMKRFGQPHEVIPAVLMFASREASYMTGQTLSVSGGLTMI